jgi:hypothetical protein
MDRLVLVVNDMSFPLEYLSFSFGECCRCRTRNKVKFNISGHEKKTLNKLMITSIQFVCMNSDLCSTH